jgi:hypothetical protein
MVTIYRIFRKAHEDQLPVPENLIRDGVFLRLTDFDLLYFGQQNKRDLWNTIFDIEKLESEGLQLSFGMKTDGHMISVLFEKTAINFIPQDRKELCMQKTRKNVSNWTKGLYPLYKNTYGITEDDRTIGIDPGMIKFDTFFLECMTNYFILKGIRDIVCGIDCDPGDLTNEQTTKQHSFSISNPSYKMRSGME